MPKNHAEYLKDLRTQKDNELRNLKSKRFQALVKYAEPLKDALKKYRPENQKKKKEEKPPEKEKKQPPKPPRKKWILGVD